MDHKPKLTIDEQIEHMKSKGIRFEKMSELEARIYLEQNNNYFKLAAYRKNYPKHPDGDKKGQYINLDFAYLVDIAVIDMLLRYRIVHIALDIEHHTKLQLLNKIDIYKEDGYSIVSDYISSLDEKQLKLFEGELYRNRTSIYCGDLIQKYDGAYPIWVLLEIIPFGQLISIYKFCAQRFSDKEMLDNYFRLLTCKDIRNASAHNNCILNDLRSGTSQHDTNRAVTRELMKIPNMKSNFRINRMSNARIQQIVTLFFTHMTIVRSSGLREAESEEMQKVVQRITKKASYYESNPLISSSFTFLKMIIDSWFLNA